MGSRGLTFGGERKEMDGQLSFTGQEIDIANFDEPRYVNLDTKY